MPELDVFETRFAAAYRRYLDEAPTRVDAAAIVRGVTVAGPRARTAGWRWALRPVPALAWLMLLALLLAALGAAALFVGSQLQRKVPAVVPPIVQAFACPAGSTPDRPGPVGQARPVFTETVAFDRQAGKLVALTHAGTGVETWTFDVCTNTWTRMHPDREPPNFDWARLVYDVDSDATILVSAGRVWIYDLQADTWTGRGAAPANAAFWLAYNPLSGFVVAAANQFGPGLWNYDVERGTWTPIRQANPAEGAVGTMIVYDPPIDRIVAPGPETWLFNTGTGIWSRSAAAMPMVIAGYGWQAPQIVYDETSKRTVVFGDGRWAAYDATADRWTILVRGSTIVYADGVEVGSDHPSYWDPVAYDAVNRRLVSWGGGNPDDPGGGVGAFDSVANRWTVLLAPQSALP